MVVKVVEIGGNANTLYPNGNSHKRAEYYGLSTDTKPTEGVHNADIFYEMDTQKVSLFDAQNLVWLEQ